MKKLEWNKGEGLSIDILTSKTKYREDGVEIGKEVDVHGALIFTDKKDVVRFALHVAKNCGIGPHEYAKLANEVMREMGDWK